MAQMTDLWVPSRGEVVYLLARKHDGVSQITSGGLSSVSTVARYLLESIQNMSKKP